VQDVPPSTCLCVLALPLQLLCCSIPLRSRSLAQVSRVVRQARGPLGALYLAVPEQGGKLRALRTLRSLVWGRLRVQAVDEVGAAASADKLKAKMMCLTRALCAKQPAAVQAKLQAGPCRVTAYIMVPRWRSQVTEKACGRDRHPPFISRGGLRVAFGFARARKPAGVCLGRLLAFQLTL